MRVLITSCDKSAWTLRPFTHLFNKYWSELRDATILTESIPKFPLPINFTIRQAFDGAWPRDKWTDGVIRFFESIPEQQILILLDDYWFIRQVDYNGIGTLAEYMRFHPEVIRLDLTTDRLYAGGAPRPGEGKDYDVYGHYDLFQVPGSPYQISLMPAIWNKAKLLDVLQNGWSPWQVEIVGTEVLNNQFSDYIVLGTRQNPIQMVNALRDGKTEIDLRGMKEEDKKEILQWLPM